MGGGIDPTQEFRGGGVQDPRGLAQNPPSGHPTNGAVHGYFPSIFLRFAPGMVCVAILGEIAVLADLSQENYHGVQGLNGNPRSFMVVDGGGQKIHKVGGGLAPDWTRPPLSRGDVPNR